MNAGIYRLVFNQCRSLWMVVAEFAKSHQPGQAARARKLRPLLMLTLLAIKPLAWAAIAAGALPNVTVTTGANTRINAPVVNPANSAGRLLTIQQGDRKAILQGSSFDIGRASAVRLNHTGGAGSATLIRINSGSPTTIAGALNAPNGDIYLINPSGILFGNGARVDVHGLVASALNIKDDDFLNDLGHLYPYTNDKRAAYSWEGDATGFANTLVQLEPDARIKAALGGSVMLFAPRVLNQGSISTNEGQVVMAAGSKVYLSFAPDLGLNTDGTAASNADGSTPGYAKDSAYRALAGVLVEVDPYQEKSGDQVTKDITGIATNGVSGRILAQRGNVTMASYLVNQSGRIVATTAVTQKGSIRLLARDSNSIVPAPAVDGAGKAVANDNRILSASRSGELVFGANSETLILPEHTAGAALAQQYLGTAQPGEPVPQAGEKSFVNSVVGALASSGNSVTDEQIFNAPTLEAIGKSITVNDGSKMVVPGGYINLSAQAAGDLADKTSNQAGVRLYLGKNTLLDASGLKGVEVASDRNFVEVLLTSNDLQDDPLNKNGFLYHKKVWFDINHLPDSRVANLAGYIKQIARDIGEKLSLAGNVKLASEGDLIQRSGSVVDVSGGSLNFTTGIHRESWLLDANGKSYALSSAPAGVVFTGFLGGSNYRQSREYAYTQGVAAGVADVSGFAAALDGQFRGAAIYGINQRQLETSANLGGSFKLTLGGATDVAVLNAPAMLADTFSASDALPDSRNSTVSLDAAMLNRAGFENVSVKTNGGNISTHAALNLNAGSQLLLSGANIAVNNNIVARGGSVNLVSTGQVSIGTNVQIDVSGLWVNDALDPTQAFGRVVSKGGDVSISGLGVATADRSVIDVSGGGWLKSGGALVNADAGSINIEARANEAPVLAGELRGYALGVGGSLSLTAPFITLGNSGFGDARELWLTPAFFQQGGFTRYNLSGNDGVLVRSGSQINVSAQNYVLNNRYQLAKTGSHVADFAKTAWLPDYLRSSTSLSLATANRLFPAFAPSGIGRGSVVVERGALLQVDAHGSRSDSSGKPIAPRIDLSGWDNLVYVDGTLRADGGTIAVTMQGVPSAADDNDYSASQAVWLGSHAQLLAAGYSQLVSNGNGTRTGSVYDGGNIVLTASKGFIVAEAGSRLDVRGANATLDILNNGKYQPTSLASNGGSITLNAREGMLLDATYQAAAPGALGGSLNILLGRGATTSIALDPAHYPGYDLFNDRYLPNQKWTLALKQNAGSGFSQGLHVGDSLQAAAGGVGKVAADSINAGGFSKATLKSEHQINFEGDVALNLPASLRLDAPVIETTTAAQVNLNAPVVMLSNAQLSTSDTAVRADYVAPDPVAGSGLLHINANLLDMRGQFTLSGFAESYLDSTGDIRLTAYSNTTTLGKLRTTGLLDMTARQIYPTTLSDFTLSVEGAGGRAAFHGTGAHDTVLSAAGKLTVNAETIDQGGVLLAPFGNITLAATHNLTLENGSLTSVAADGALIPYGYTNRDGLDYLYDFGTGVASLTAPPERVVKLNAPNVTQATGSVVDVSSGGDLYAYEWVPGVGGSTDVLANGAKQGAFSELGSNASNTWVIMPGRNFTFGSYDTQYWNGSKIQAGDAVYLSAAPGLAAGFYTLLPARYALLPGAMLVTAVSGHQDMSGNQALAQNDGSNLVSGHLAAYTSGGYVATSRTAGFVLRAGSDAHKLAEYNDTLSSKRFAADNNVMQTLDAGRFSVAATGNLVLDGVLKAMHAQGGRGAEVDVAAPNLLVVDHGAQTGSVVVDGQHYLAVDENTLSNMNAASLLLGGTRSNGVVDVVASEVRFGANANVSGSEVILAASDKVRLQNGATLTGSGNAAAGRDLSIGSVGIGGTGLVDGNGALLRVAAGDKVDLTRNNTDRSRGDLLIDAGAMVHGDGAVQLDATHGMNVAGELEFGKGAALTVAAGRVSLGAPDGGAQVTDGLWLTQSQLMPLQSAGSLLLKSYSTIDVYGAVDLGNANLDLTLQGAGIAGYQNTGKSANITARSFTLNNADAVDADAVSFANVGALSDGTTPALGSGSLNVNAKTIISGANTVRVAGFDQLNLNAGDEIIAQGKGSLKADNAMTLAATRITAQTGADHTLEAKDGLLEVKGSGGTPTLAATQAQAAKLQLKGRSVLLANGARIDAAGAKITLQATGLAATDNVTLQNGAAIVASGTRFTLKDQSVALPAGSVALIADHGNVEVQAGALIDLAATTKGNAGTLTVSAVNGIATLAGAVHGGNQAEALVDVGGVSDFSQTLAALQEFSGAQSYRLRNGDATIAATDTVTTSHFSLTADNGAINVNGKVDASGDKGGRIEMYAKNDVTINRGAQLLAKGLADKQSTAGTIGDGGSVILSSDSGTVSAIADAAGGLAGALIDVSGDKVGSIQGAGGSVILRAARNGADNTAFNPVNTTSTITGYVVDVSDFSLTPGATLAFIPDVNGKTRLNVNGSGLKLLKKNGGDAVSASDMTSGQTYVAVYDGTNFQLVSAVDQTNGSDALGTGVNVAAGTTAAITGAGKVQIEAVRVYDNTSIDSKLQNLIAADTNAFSSRVGVMASAYALTRDGVSASVTPGIEIRSAGDLTLDHDWLLGSSSATPAAAEKASRMLGGGILTLRAAGNLLLDNNLSYEQYGVNGNVITPRSASWSYRLVAGADAASVNPEAVQTGGNLFTVDGESTHAGSMTLAGSKFVRTGSGFIDVATGLDINLNSGAAIYTEGTPDSAKTGFDALIPNFTTYKELYSVNGGAIRLNALGSILGQADTPAELIDTSLLTANTWLARATLRPATGLPTNPQLRWWSRFDKFTNGIGALGGGDVVAKAGGNISNLEFASASNGRMGGDKTKAPDLANLTVNGGGDMQIKALGDIANTLLVAGKGTARVEAGGAANVRFELMDASAQAYADGNVSITQVSNPTITTSSLAGGKGAPTNIYFFSYGQDSAVSAVSAAGDVSFAGSEIYPGVLYAAAPNGNVGTTGQVLYPSALGNATLLAGKDINKVDLKMSDMDTATLPQISTLPKYDGTDQIPNLGDYVGSAAHTPGILHLLDTTPVRFYAGNDVVFDAGATVLLPKSVEVYAGHDVIDPNLIVQNNRATDVSVIEAGNNIFYQEPPLSEGQRVASTATLQVAGPGRLQLIAGKDIDLGSSEGIRSVGDLYNPYLTAQGADIMVRTGAAGGINYSAMIAAYLDPASAGAMSAIYLPQLSSYMESRQAVSSLSASEALAQFKALDVNQQSQFINSLFYAELRAGGRDALDAKSGSYGDYTRSERAILRMFPDFSTNTALANQSGSLMSAFKGISNETVTSPGDLKLFYSQIRSERGGRVELLVPGGMINAGLAVSGTLKNKPATDLGIVSIRGGDIDAFVRSNFQVNQSRVFTLGGSDLLLFSALSNIDAGRGAKTSSSTPPPVLRIKNGQVYYDYSGAVSGSGIAALTATGGDPGTVDLFAPYGEINAGEAGIRSAGNINLGARVVIGAENISAGGVTTGVPAVGAVSMSFGAGVTADPNSSSKSGEQLAQSSSSVSTKDSSAFTPSFVTVDVIGMGDGTASSSAQCSADNKQKDCQR